MSIETDRIEPLLDELLKPLNHKLTFTPEKATLLGLAQKLMDENRMLASDKASVGHIEICSVVIALFRYLGDKMLMDACLEAIRYAFVDSLAFITSQTEAYLNQSSDPFKDIVAISKQKETEYGDSFEFYRRQDDDQAYLLEVKKCFYCKVLNRNHAQELMPIFCDFDTLWMKAIKPEKHGFRFDRPETIGTGGNLCKFYFTKVTG